MNNSSRLDTLIYFVTARCNGSCRSCFYWDRLQPDGGELQLSTVNKISMTMPAFRRLLISGGEPFLRQNGGLDEIVGLFIRNNNIKIVSIPTNGLDVNLIIDKSRLMLSKNPEVLFHIGVSVDGMKDVNDNIRNYPGHFDRAIGTLKELVKLRENFSNLKVFAATVITGDNIDNIKELSQWLYNDLDLNNHYIELIRGNPKDDSLLNINIGKLKDLNKYVVRLYSRYDLKAIIREKNIFLRAAKYLLRFRHDVFNKKFFSRQLEVFEKNKPWGFPCQAADKIAVISHDGCLAACELRKSVLDLADCGYDFNRAWNSKKMNNERREIINSACHCSHGCFLALSQP